MIKGLVQGVGFRPFIYRLATNYHLKGEVDNRTNGVLISVEGEEENVFLFRDAVLNSAPAASQIKSVDVREKKLAGFTTFEIVRSRDDLNQITEISPDIAVCDECISDMTNDENRKDYPFINCTNCGPRFSIIEGLPYDREMTSMKVFPMCPDCEKEYNDISDRRFHAQPIACNKCGPAYSYTDTERSAERISEILDLIALRINRGEAVAIKGLGGYNLVCDALNENAVHELRLRKQRDAKPFAVMFRDIEAAGEFCHLTKEERQSLESWKRPIVILDQMKSLAPSVNNGLNTVGAMLPYLPLHYQIFKKTDTPAIVLTSGNLSDEPIIIDDDIAFKKLMPVAGAVVTNNRAIVNRCDDSVIRYYDKKPGMIRRSRGFVPSPIDLKMNADGILALGAEQKNTFTIGRDNQAIMSQYIGDLKNYPAYTFLCEAVDRFRKMFLFEPAMIACDLHPDYLSTSHARLLEEQLGIPLVKVQHHHAHIASCMAEQSLDEEVIGICLDGTGFGADGNTWGSEFFRAGLSGYTRLTHFDYIPLPGGDKAVDEPWRMAVSYIYKYFGKAFNYQSVPSLKQIPDDKIALVIEMIEKGINTPLTSGAGRLFDAVSVITGLCIESAFDSEAPMRLESIADPKVRDHYPFRLGECIVFSDTIKAVMEDLGKADVAVIAARFHNTVAEAIVQTAIKIRESTYLNNVVLSGGVFQNRYLLERCLGMLEKNNFIINTNRLVPANDGGISLGQLAVASKIRELCV